ncbi:ribosomal RNA small subunit methyltransferase G [Francisella endosymbiont of Amblyomma maculatum]|nr:ribosomal RNA small subunit methyltransferase G [Francisella endosymbiont of Amblyomma maculatum]
MDTMKDKIKQVLNQLNIQATDIQITQWLDYLKLLEKWNKVYNMTAIKNINDMLVKHLFDSLVVAKYIKGNSTIDVGTGGGLPGVVLAILYPQHQFTLVDSVGKKIIFLKNVKKTLGLANIQPLNSRVENLQGSFNNIISRAFSSVDTFYELCKHLLTYTNQMLAMKGRDLEERNLESLPLNIEKYSIKVPFLNVERNLIVMRKKS